MKPFSPVQVTSEECGGAFEKMFRRFIRRAKDEGTINEVRSRRGFIKPSQARRAKAKKSCPR